MSAAALVPRSPRRRRGFSLVEVVLSSTLLLIGISAVVITVNVALALHEHQRKVARALVIAEKRTESLLLLFEGSLDLTDGVHPPSGFEGFTEAGRPGGTTFRLTYTVTPAESPRIGTGLDITVSWDERIGERSLTLSTVR